LSLAGESGVLTGPGLLVRRVGAVRGRKGHAGGGASRPPRPLSLLRLGDDARTASGEREGVDYFFSTGRKFERRMAANDFLETREYNGHLYGTPRSFIEEALRAGLRRAHRNRKSTERSRSRNVSGSGTHLHRPRQVLALRSRLEARRTETNAEIAARLEIAHDEFTFVRNFDYLVINEEAQPQQAVDDLEAIVRAERYRIHRYPENRLKELENT
jgi:guanylate kinase